MREIKFRIWDEVLMHMYTPEMNQKEPNLWAIPRAEGGILKKDDCILMQYTGLKDKNGKEIYEGDVLEWEDRRVIDSRVIEFSDGGFWLVGKTNEPWRERFMPSEPTREIIGNIYENPELIKL